VKRKEIISSIVSEELTKPKFNSITNVFKTNTAEYNRKIFKKTVSAPKCVKEK